MNTTGKVHPQIYRADTDGGSTRMKLFFADLNSSPMCEIK